MHKYHKHTKIPRITASYITLGQYRIPWETTVKVFKLWTKGYSYVGNRGEYKMPWDIPVGTEG